VLIVNSFFEGVLAGPPIPAVLAPKNTFWLPSVRRGGGSHKLGASQVLCCGRAVSWRGRTTVRQGHPPGVPASDGFDPSTRTPSRCTSGPDRI